ncbi:hypothetical protein [Streptomyces sp. NPDC090025]|uniref:hypothetical protein n=1 Tax=Streptomyces sp. NPDC090025 TaxID=3365922 RepID=UPI0038368CDF
MIVATLLRDAHAGRTHEVTGPRALTFAEVAAELTRVTGRQVTYAPLSEAEFAAMMVGFGLPEPEAVWLAGLFAMLLDGHNSAVTDGVERVLGRAPRDFSVWADRAYGAAPAAGARPEPLPVPSAQA